MSNHIPDATKMVSADIIEMARKAGLIVDANQSGFDSVVAFAALVRADERDCVMNEPITKAHWQRFENDIRADERTRLLAGVEMPEPSYRAAPYSNVPGAKVTSPVDYYTADQLRETVASAVARKDAEIKAIATANRDNASELQDYIEALKAENERLKARSQS